MAGPHCQSDRPFRALREWLPRLVGMEHRVALTRESTTPAVHYLRFGFSEAQVAEFEKAQQVTLVSTHPAYEAETVLSPAVRGELLADLLGTTKPLPLG